jgi:hypothetical protein
MMHILLDIGLLYFLEPDAILCLSIINQETLQNVTLCIPRHLPIYSDWKPHQIMAWHRINTMDIINLGVIHHDLCRLCMKKYYKYSFEEHPFIESGIFAHAICLTKHQRRREIKG